PGLHSRADALAQAGHDVLGLFLATVILLVVAGCLEAFVSPSSLAGAAKIAIGLSVAAVFYGWLLLAGREHRRPAAVSLEAAQVH
ncbi:MAG: stage II sporulation protein M, partial [Candidatus Dormiibacterota bacterium]